MNSIPLSASSTKERYGTTQILERLRQSFLSMTQSLRSRFQNASVAFKERLEAEARIAYLESQLKDPGTLTSKEVCLGAVLIHRHSSFYLDIYEGNNYFRITPNAQIERVADESTEIPSHDFHLQLKDYDLRFSSTTGSVKPSLIQTNDSITLGQYTFLVKILPTEYRTLSRIYYFKSKSPTSIESFGGKQ